VNSGPFLRTSHQNLLNCEHQGTLAYHLGYSLLFLIFCKLLYKNAYGTVVTYSIKWLLSQSDHIFTLNIICVGMDYLIIA
jgi:hypothetical protein